MSKLPLEILSHIFSFVPHSPDVLDNISRGFGLQTRAQHIENLLPLLRVCSRWRSIVTTSSFLWSTIDNRDLLALSISSKYQPISGTLDVHIVGHNLFRPAHFDFWNHPEALRCFRDCNPIFVDLFRNEGYRIRELEAEIPAVLLPALTEFSGESLRACELWPSEGSMDELGAIRPLFNNVTPNLRSLILRSLLFIPTNHFPSLTHLLLVGGPRIISPDGPFTFSNFMLFLSRCPNLQVLHLSDIDVISLQELPDDRVSAPLNLPYLRKFSNEEVSLDHSRENPPPYFGPHFRCALLAHLRLSPDCVIRLSTILPEDLGRTLHCLPFDNPLASVYLGAHDPQRGSNGDHNTFNDIGPECFSIMATDVRRQRGVRIDFQMPGSRYPLTLATEPPKALMRDAIRSAPLLSAVEELWVIPAANPLLWEPDSFLVGFPNLTTLTLGLFPRQSALIPVVVDDAPENEDLEVAGCDPLNALEVRDDLVIPCPRLRTLCVYGFTERQAMLLYNVVLSRGEAGYPIRRLVVGFIEPPEITLLELVGGLWGLVEDFTLLKHGEKCPDDLLWDHRLPSVCRDSSERNSYWPAWM